MRYLLDTNTCIGWIRNSQPKLVARIKQANSSHLAICSIVLGELFYGIERAGASHRAINESRVALLRGQFASFPFDDAAAERYGVVRAHLAALGTPIGPNDLMIASIALANGMTLVTNNVSEFARVPGLTVEDWQ